jgi:SLT domain-containing protein
MGGGNDNNWGGGGYTPGAVENQDADYMNLAKGGIIRKPTRARIAENGPEAVVPVGPRMQYKQGGR